MLPLFAATLCQHSSKRGENAHKATGFDAK
jgi:hypothetical protein